jgi:hypothetical protein
MRIDGHEYVSVSEFARRVGTQTSNVRYAINRGRIQLSGETEGQTKLIDWTTESEAWRVNRTKQAEPYKKPRPSRRKENRKEKEHDWNKLERHIGDSEVYDTGKMGIDPSTSRFDDIPDIDNINAPEGSVAYYQAKKLAVDALRNLNKLKQETAQLISVPDAVNLYCHVLRQLSDSVQNIPSRITNLIVASIRKSVETWRTPPENLEAEIFKFLTIQCKDILTELSKRISASAKETKDFIYESIK